MSMQDTSPETVISDDFAVSRMFDLVRNGDVTNQEFAQLDSVIYGRLIEAYGNEKSNEYRPQIAA